MNRRKAFSPIALLAEDVSKHQRRDNRSIRFDDEARRSGFQFSPGDFFIRHRAAVGAIRRCAVGYLAEVTPQAALLAQILRDQRYDANWKVARDPAAYLEKADRLVGGILPVPLDQASHLLDAGLNHLKI